MTDTGLFTLATVAKRCRKLGYTAVVNDQKRWLELVDGSHVDRTLTLTANPDGIRAFGFDIQIPSDDDLAVWKFVEARIASWKARQRSAAT